MPGLYRAIDDIDPGKQTVNNSPRRLFCPTLQEMVMVVAAPNPMRAFAAVEVESFIINSVMFSPALFGLLV